MRECHPALHLGGCTANQTGSSNALQPANQSAQQHLIQGMTDKQGRSIAESMGGRVGDLQGMGLGESVSKVVQVCSVCYWLENNGVMWGLDTGLIAKMFTLDCFCMKVLWWLHKS